MHHNREARAGTIQRRTRIPLLYLLVGAIPAHGAVYDSNKLLQLVNFATFAIPETSGAVDIDHPKDGSGRVFVSTNDGKIFGFSATGESLGVLLDVSVPGTLPDFSDEIAFSTGGLTYIAFHPDYAQSGQPGHGKLYTQHRTTVPGSRAPDYSGAGLATRPGDVLSQYAITEWQIDAADPNRIDPSSRREVIRFEFSGPGPRVHSVGGLAFNPFSEPGDADYGNLYIPIGDMNNSPDVANWQHVQDQATPFGKILRINPLQQGVQPYSVPPDNPFNDGGPLLDDDGNVEEIYAWGFRNPQNMSFAEDAAGASRLVVFDIGARAYEEVNLVSAGDNHGWPRYDGPDEGNLEVIPLLPAGSRLAYPAAVYERVIPNLPGGDPVEERIAITGGYVVSDPGDRSFRSQLVFSDLPRSAFFHADFAALLAADAAGTQASIAVMSVSIDGSSPGLFRDLIGAERGDVRFGVDESGRLFVVSRQIDTAYLTNFIADQHPGPGCPNDRDCDLIADASDNCTEIANPPQDDTDVDGHGNECDPDYNQDCFVNFLDLALLESNFFGAEPAVDLVVDGTINFADLGRMRALFFTAPGPSASACSP